MIRSCEAESIMSNYYLPNIPDMVKIEHFGSRGIVLIALTKTCQEPAKQGMIKKRAIMLGPIFDSTKEITPSVE
jgi:hypothetical protein